MAGRPKLPEDQKLVPLTIRMKPAGYSWLLVAAARAGVSRSDLVRLALQRLRADLEAGRVRLGS